MKNRVSKLDIIHDIVRSLTGALSSAALYAPDHPRVNEQFARLIETFRMFQQQEQELLLARVEDELLYLGKPLEKTASTARLVKYCSEQSIGFIRFTAGFTRSDLQQLIKVLLGKTSIDSLSLVTQSIQVGRVDTPGEGISRPISSYEEMTNEEKVGIKEQFEAIAEKGTINVQQVSSVIAGFIEAFRQNANPFLALVPIRKQDEYTFTHSIDVGILNIAQGMALGIEGQMLHDIGVAGMLHDAGKIFVDREILNKPGKLNDNEFDIIKQHPSQGAQYLMTQEGIPRLAVFSAYEHHMRYDLAGYPDVPPNWQLNIASQMTMISDTFDALRTRRSYKSSWDFSKVSGLMLSLSGSQLNPDLTLNFLKFLAQKGEDIESFADGDEDLEAMDAIIGCSCSLENPRCG